MEANVEKIPGDPGVGRPSPRELTHPFRDPSCSRRYRAAIIYIYLPLSLTGNLFLRFPLLHLDNLNIQGESQYCSYSGELIQLWKRDKSQSAGQTES